MKGSGPPEAGSLTLLEALNFLFSLIPCSEVYCPLGGAGMGLMEGESVTAKLSHWLFEASGWGGGRYVEGLFLHCQPIGLNGVMIRGKSSAWLGTQGLPVKNKVPVKIRLLPWPGFVL